MSRLLEGGDGYPQALVRMPIKGASYALAISTSYFTTPSITSSPSRESSHSDPSPNHYHLPTFLLTYFLQVLDIRVRDPEPQVRKTCLGASSSHHSSPCHLKPGCTCCEGIFTLDCPLQTSRTALTWLQTTLIRQSPASGTIKTAYSPSS